MTEDNLYRGRVVVITGASSGFGRGTALELARRGAHVVLAARSADTLREIAHDCEELGGQAIALETDVSNEQAVTRLFEQTLSKFNRCDVWINNAGVAAIGRFDEVPLADHEQVLKTDLLGTIYGSYLALKHFRQRGEGILINLASVIGKIPAPFYASYAAAKFGIVGFCDSLRQELSLEKNSKIRVCTVMPMAHSTEFFEHAGNYTGHEAAPIPPTYDPQVTIDALVKLVIEPEDEIITGRQGPMFNILHHLMPHAMEKMMASKTEKVQLDNPAPAVKKSGSVHEPSHP
jgi:short-subunit dehydrogenase